MTGLIGVGQAYGAKALSGFIQESAEQQRIDLMNKQIAAQEKANSKKLGVEGGTTGYAVATSPMVAKMLAPQGSAMSASLADSSMVTTSPLPSSLSTPGLTLGTQTGEQGLAASLGSGGSLTGGLGAAGTAGTAESAAALGLGNGVAGGAALTAPSAAATFGTAGTVAGAAAGPTAEAAAGLTAAAGETAVGALGAETGAEAGAALGPIGIIGGAALGFLLSELF